MWSVARQNLEEIGREDEALRTFLATNVAVPSLVELGVLIDEILPDILMDRGLMSDSEPNELGSRIIQQINALTDLRLRL